jgi:hypothetical protein
MARKHGKDTVVKVNSVDLSQYTSESELSKTTDTHDTTHYGDDAHEFDPGLNNGTFTMGGTYDSTAATGPRAALNIVYGLNAAVPIVRWPEGMGMGLAADTFSAILTNYTESNPVADMIKWKADFQITGNVTITAQA